jgi:hypothetical protein
VAIASFRKVRTMEGAEADGAPAESPAPPVPEPD